MNKITLLAGAASLAVAAMAASAASADDAKLDQLKAQGFARVAIANEPPYTAVAADGKVSGAAPDVAREIGNLYGAQFLNPPSAPMFIIDRHGEVQPLPFGVKSAADLQKALEPFLNDAM